METIEKIKKKLNGLKEEAQKAMRQLSKQGEIEQAEAELKKLQAEEARAKEETMAANRAEALKEAHAFDSEEKDLQEKLVTVRKKKAEALARFEENIPRRRIQTSSSEFIRLQREVEFLQEMGFATESSKLLGEKFASRIFEKRKRTEQALIDCIPSKLERFKKQGWFVSPGQDPIKAEILDNENTMEVGRAVPDVFYPRMD